MRVNNKRQGFVLIFVLWVLAFLSVFIIQIGMAVRQQATMVSRLERRAQLRRAAQSGIAKAQSMLRQGNSPGCFLFTREFKKNLLNNPEVFQNIRLGNTMVDVRYLRGEIGHRTPKYGVVDEEGKINLNQADDKVLARLFQAVLELPLEKAQDLARAVVEWRGGEEQLTGFYSQDYYSNLEFPYSPKKAPFERPEELLLVQGFDKAMWKRLWDYVTIYGPGVVNINSASAEVLSAAGLSPRLADKVISARGGVDGEEGTEDDFIFYPEDMSSGFLAYEWLTGQEKEEMHTLASQARIGVCSEFFRISSQARPVVASGTGRNAEIKSITSVFRLKGDKIIYWREDY